MIILLFDIVIISILFCENSIIDLVWNVLLAAVGVVTLFESLNDCDAITLTLYSLALPLLKPPNPNSCESIEELTCDEPPDTDWTLNVKLSNCIRFLAIDAVQAAKSGHPGMPMGMAYIATILFK